MVTTKAPVLVSQKLSRRNGRRTEKSNGREAVDGVVTVGVSGWSGFSIPESNSFTQDSFGKYLTNHPQCTFYRLE